MSARKDTKKHIRNLRSKLKKIRIELKIRGREHDRSKLESPELEVFDVYTGRLKDLKYGSEEYKQCLIEMKPALLHHYSVNRHHPEYFEKGVKGMDLIDLIEMLCDWKAASERHLTGNIYESLKINKKRFGISEELNQILLNTIKYL